MQQNIGVESGGGVRRPPLPTPLTGCGSDIMVLMAIPSFGGMLIEAVTMLVVPVLYCALQEKRLGAV